MNHFWKIYLVYDRFIFIIYHCFHDNLIIITPFPIKGYDFYHSLPPPPPQGLFFPTPKHLI